MTRVRELHREERGSLSVAVMVFIGIVMLVGMMILEISWRNHAMQTLQQTADYSAEAGSQFRVDYAKVMITRRHIETWYEQVCEVDDEGFLNCWHEPRSRTIYDYPQVTDKEKAVREEWHSLFNCSSSAYTGWQCLGKPTVLDRWTVFTTAEPVATETFWANWRSRPTVQVLQVRSIAYGGTRSVQTLAQVRYSPLFFRFLGTDIFWVEGRAQGVLQPLVF